MYYTFAFLNRIVLSQIKTFWHQLQWPDSETSYAFISRIIDDSCQAVMFYADQMRAKVEQRLQEAVGDDREEEEDGEGQVVKEELFFSREQCLAVNNIDYVLKVSVTHHSLTHMHAEQSMFLLDLAPIRARLGHLRRAFTPGG